MCTHIAQKRQIITEVFSFIVSSELNIHIAWKCSVCMCCVYYYHYC